MSDFSVRSDSVDVEQIMRQIRARIRDKRGVDYTEQQIQELANAKLEKFLDAKGIRSDLLDQYRQHRSEARPPNFEFEDTSLFESDKGIVRAIRTLLQPILKLFFNYNKLSRVLHVQSSINQYVLESDPLYYELLHNLVLELTRAGVEVKNLKMRVESLQSRLEFTERRARALEGVVQYRPEALKGKPRSDMPRTGAAETRGPARTPGTGTPGTVPEFGTVPDRTGTAETVPQSGTVPDVATGTPAARGTGTAGTVPEFGTVPGPITGGESVRTRRRRRRRGRRGQGGAPGTETPGAVPDVGPVPVDEGTAGTVPDPGTVSNSLETGQENRPSLETDHAAGTPSTVPEFGTVPDGTVPDDIPDERQ